jgi:hypothetical protein
MEDPAIIYNISTYTGTGMWHGADVDVDVDVGI